MVTFKEHASQRWERFKGLLKRLLQSKRSFVLASLALLTFFLVLDLCHFIRSLPSWLHWICRIPLDHSFFTGCAESIGAGLYLAWAAYLWRVWLKRVFHARDVTILAPMQIATAPLIIAKAKPISEEHDLRLEVDLRYAGREALESLGSDPTKFAVASDVALCLFLKPDEKELLWVLPFVKITNHLKLVVKRDSSINTIEDLRKSTGKIGYYANTVHHHFLIDELKIPNNEEAPRLANLSNILACYDAQCSRSSR